MAELVVLVFDNEEGALQARDRLLEIQKHRMLQLADAAVVVRRQDGKVKIKQLHGLVGPGAFGGAFWGLVSQGFTPLTSVWEKIHGKTHQLCIQR